MAWVGLALLASCGGVGCTETGGRGLPAEAMDGDSSDHGLDALGSASDGAQPADDGVPDATGPPPDGGATPALDGAVSTEAVTELDIVYLEVGTVRLAMDVRIPAGPGPFPMVVIVHGGAFFMGDKNGGNTRAWAEYLPTMGLASSTINYRLTGDFDGDDVFPGPLEDVKCALRWLRTRAAHYRLDTDAFAILGGSAGGYFANAVSVSGGVADFDGMCPDATSGDSTVQAGVSFYGISDWVTLGMERGHSGPSSEARFVGADCAEAPADDACALASPVTYVDAADPPMFLLHSDDDPSIPVSQSHQLRDALRAAGVPVEYVEVMGKGHGWAGRFRDPDVVAARDQVVAWLRDQFARRDVP